MSVNWGIAIFIIAILFFIYDFAKDGMRILSSYRDLFSGKGPEGLQKNIGFTRGNIIRNISKGILLIVSLVLMTVENKKELSPIPEEIKAKLV